MNQKWERAVPENNHPHSKHLFWWMSLSFLFIGFVIYLLWFFIWRIQATTEDAYVGGNQVFVTAQIPGIVTNITADDTQIVDQGHVLIELDPTDAKIALEEKEAQLAEAVRTVAALFVRADEIRKEIAGKCAEAVVAAQDYVHRKGLVEQGAISQEEFEHIEGALSVSMAQLQAKEEQLKEILAQIGDTEIASHPLVEERKAQLRAAWVFLNRCAIRSPVRGMVARRQVQVGEAVNPNIPLLAVVPFDQMWVDANFREVDLKHLRIGQRVKLHADAYGRSVEYTGDVVGIAAGTGSVFSVLPAQNATGNWIKIVQRVPVRIYLDDEQLLHYPLRLGLSMHVKVHTRNKTGPFLPRASTALSMYKTNVFDDELKGVQERIEEIIYRNLPEISIERHGICNSE